MHPDHLKDLQNTECRTAQPEFLLPQICGLGVRTYISIELLSIAGTAGREPQDRCVDSSDLCFHQGYCYPSKVLEAEIRCHLLHGAFPDSSWLLSDSSSSWPPSLNLFPSYPTLTWSPNPTEQVLPRPRFTLTFCLLPFQSPLGTLPAGTNSIIQNTAKAHTSPTGSLQPSFHLLPPLGTIKVSRRTRVRKDVSAFFRHLGGKQHKRRTK